MKLTPQPEPVLPPLESATTFSCVLFNPSQPQFQKWTENDVGNGDSISASPFCRATAPWQAFSHVEVIVVVDALEASFFFSLGNSEVRKIQVFVFESCMTLPSAEFFVAGIRVAFLVRSKALHGIAHGCMHQKIMPACSSVKVPNFPVPETAHFCINRIETITQFYIHLYYSHFFLQKGNCYTVLYARSLNSRWYSCLCTA